ncbi:MAG: hypothetical protein ABIM40_05655 [Pseudomonadota bacterium]
MNETTNKAGTPLSRLYRLLFPFFSTWLVAAYIHLCMIFALFVPVNNNIKRNALFLVVVLLEMVFTRRFIRMHPESLFHRKKALRILTYAGNIGLWAMFFLVWVDFVHYTLAFTPALRFYGAYFFLLTVVLWRSMGMYTVAAILLWAGLYYALTVRRGRFRIITSFAPYFLITYLFFLHQWHLGGTGWASTESIARQPGVEKVMDSRELSEALEAQTDPWADILVIPGLDVRSIPRKKIHVRNRPRDVWYEPGDNSVFLVYGATYNVGDYYPVIVKKNLSTGKIQWILSKSNIRILDHSGDVISFGPWTHPYIYQVSKENLQVVKKIERQVSVPDIRWEPNCVLPDFEKDKIYVSIDYWPSILTYDLDTGELVDSVELVSKGLVITGGFVWNLVQSHASRRLYSINAPGPGDLAEVDPDTMEITNQMDFGDLIGTGLFLDQTDQKLYYQSGFFNSLYKVDLKTFTMEREYKGEFHVRRLGLDRERNVMYLLGYVSGKVTALDLDSGKHLWKVPVGGRPHGLDLQGQTLWVHSMAGVFRLDLDTIWKEKGFAGTRYDLAGQTHAPGSGE